MTPRPVLLLATRNRHKVDEIRAILGERFDYSSLADFPDAPAVVEDAPTFAGNATKKAVELARWLSNTPDSKLQTSNAFVLADDSGLEVDVLNGAPGVHSARFAAMADARAGQAGNSSDADNNARLLRLLGEVPAEKRTARFRCVLALVAAKRAGDLAPELFDGVCEGRIGFAPRGQGGFGYDPLFVPDGFNLSFAELGGDVKNSLSHRAKALLNLQRRLERS